MVASGTREPAGDIATQRVYGRILDAATARPLAGVWVWPAAAPSAAVRTTATGKFNLRLDEKQGPLKVAAPGYLVSTQQPWIGEKDVRLQPSALAAGQVIDATGRPARWAALRLHLEEQASPLVATICGPDGRFVIGAIPPGETTELQAMAASGLQAGSLSLEPLRPGEDRRDLRIVVSSVAAVRGRVVDGDGRAVAAARLRLVSEPEETPCVDVPDAAGIVAAQLSATDGRFELRTRAPGRFQLEIAKAGFALQVLPGLLLATAAERLDLGDIPIETGVNLIGQVLDEQLAPIPNAKVEVRAGTDRESARSFRDPWFATTDAVGSFALKDLPPIDGGEVVVRHPDYSQALLKDVEIPGPPLEIVLQTGVVLTGRVVEAGGRGVPEAVVVVSAAAEITEAASSTQEPPMDEQRTVDPDGRFSFRNLSPATVTVRAVAPSFRTAERSGLELRRGAPLEDIEVVLEPGAALHGTVRATDGSPASGALVTLQGATGTPSAMRADAEGRFAFEGLAPGPVELKAEHESYRSVERPMDLAAGDNQVKLVLPLGISIAGQVVDDRGTPIAGVELTAQEGSASVLRVARSNGDGSFRFDGLAPGLHEIVARAPSFISVRRLLELGEVPVEGLELTLKPGGAVRGRLIGLTVSDLAHVEVAAFAPQYGSVMGTVETAESYRIDGLAPGEWMVTAAVAPGSRQARAAVRIGVEGETEIDLDFGKGLVLSGRVRVDERPLAGGEVELFGLAGQGVASATTSDGGTFELSGLAPGPYSFRLRQRASGFAYQQTLEISTSQQLDLELGTARITGRVLTADGTSPLAGADILLQLVVLGGTSQRVGSHSDSLGFFSLPRVQSGEYLLTVRLGERAALEQRLSVTPGIDQDLVLQVNPADP